MKRGKQEQASREITWFVLPSEIEDNILSRLPVKSLLRFRCVCKHWCNLVTNPYFIKMQLNRSNQIKEGLKLVHAYGAEVYCIDVEACRNQCVETRGQMKIKMHKELVLPFRDQFKNLFWEVSGSCNGLLCLSTYDGLYLLNPATQEYKRLPYPKIRFSLKLTVFGFGYSPRTDEYKVVMIIYYYRSEHSVHCDDVYVYTVGTNSSWRSIGGTEYRIEGTENWFHYPYHHALVNGAIHWMARGKLSFSMAPISFDFGDEKFRKLSLPKSFRQEDTTHPMWLAELDGFLSLYQCKVENFNIWAMKDYGDVQSWTKVFSVANPILCSIWGLFKPLYILKKDEEVLCESDSGYFILDLVKGKICRLYLRDELYNSSTKIYFESLVSLGADHGSKQERRGKEGGKLAVEATGD
ncbi:hypothetical protein NE237_017760 [Protea cynaroides]|uniref:F-box domain-containing protein n=1 Tax=Protea cynaroides TaxID=273540 RepID=A0A9Q0K8R7_9MAGN|nr:hypothetical protein NE237_017760 [Protea cynaroides]